MKQLLFSVLLLGASTTFAETNIKGSVDYSGLWQDKQGAFYSINHTASSIAIVGLGSFQRELSPFQHGKIEVTEQKLDLAIDGDGFFVFTTSDGFVYSREGKFSISDRGHIVNEHGQPLATKNHSTPIPSYHDEKLKSYSEIVISKYGVLSLQDPETGDLYEYDRIVLASIYPSHLRYSEDLYTATNPDAVDYFYPNETSDDAVIMQGALESRSYTWQEYQAYSGEFTGTIASLNDSRESFGWNEISFNSESIAIIRRNCSSETEPFCDEKVREGNQLTKLF